MIRFVFSLSFLIIFSITGVFASNNCLDQYNCQFDINGTKIIGIKNCTLPHEPHFSIQAHNVLDAKGELKHYWVEGHTVCDVLEWLDAAMVHVGELKGMVSDWEGVLSDGDKYDLGLYFEQGVTGGGSTSKHPGSLTFDIRTYDKNRFARNMHATVVHEFFHILQSLVDTDDSPAGLPWVIEGTARMFEDVVFDPQNPYNFRRYYPIYKKNYLETILERMSRVSGNKSADAYRPFLFWKLMQAHGCLDMQMVLKDPENLFSKMAQACTGVPDVKGDKLAGAFVLYNWSIILHNNISLFESDEPSVILGINMTLEKRTVDNPNFQRILDLTEQSGTMLPPFSAKSFLITRKTLSGCGDINMTLQGDNVKLTAIRVKSKDKSDLNNNFTIQSGDAPYALSREDREANLFVTVTNTTAKAAHISKLVLERSANEPPKPKAGVVEVTAGWSKPELNYDLIVSWDAGETDIKDTGCPMEHFYVSSEKVIYPGKYPVWLVPKDPDDPIWDDPDIYPFTVSVTITTPGKGADAQWKEEATILSKSAMDDFGHLADIKVYRVDEEGKVIPDSADGNDNDTPDVPAPIQFDPVVPPECPPVKITPPVVPSKPIYFGGGGGGGGWIGWYGGGGSIGGIGGIGGSSGTSTIPRQIQSDPACGGDIDCLPKPNDDQSGNGAGNGGGSPYVAPAPEAGGAPTRDLEEKDECEGGYSCYCMPCEYKVIPYLKQIYFGPLRDANFTIYSLEGYRNGLALYKGVTTHGEGLYDSGEIEVPESIIRQMDDEAYYIIKAEGGEDIDANDDFVVDAVPTPNKGTVYAIAKGKEIKYTGFKVNILTTVSFVLARDLIDDNATQTQIDEKLSDIASRLLRDKLYPDMTQPGITNTDLLVWLPTVDQDVLLKTYAPLETMVHKLFQDEDIYDDAYVYVYGKDENVTDDRNGTAEQPLPPLIRSFSGHISEDAAGGTVVGKIEILRGAEGMHFGALSGKGSEKFEIDDNGTIRLKEGESLDYETKWLYILKADAYNDFGNSGKVSVFISVDDVVDAPKFVKFEGGFVDENASAGTVVGQLYYDQGASPIDRIELYGTSQDLFEADANGTIRLRDQAALDYETTRYYGLIAQAFNAHGKSIPTVIYLNVNDIADVPRITGYEGGYVSEDAAPGTYIGRLAFDPGGAPVTSVILSGTGSENFTIDRNGTVRLASNADLDYERFYLYRITATVVNRFGEDSYPIFVSVRDAQDVPSFVSFEGGNVDENSPIGTWVGKVTYSPGASKIISMRLSGTDAEYFAIDTDGNITLKKPVDFEEKNSFIVLVTASNAQGDSRELTLHLFVNDVPEQAAVLDDTVFNRIKENVAVGMILGRIPVLYEGSSPIEGYVLSGVGSEAFTIDRDGNVSVVKSLDYETKSIYNLRVQAKNEAGLSREVNLIIRLEDVGDTVPVLRNTILSVEENASVGTVIGRVSVVSEGDSPIRAYHLSGAGSENFTIDSNGTIRISQGADLDYERLQAYSLSLRASNGAGDSMPVSMHITVKNIPDTTPILSDGSWRIDENSPAGTKVGKINVTSYGDSAIDSFGISGEGCDQFAIDANGTVKVASGANLDYESINNYQCTIKAHSTSGYSNNATYEIWIDNVADTLPVLSYTTVGSVDENETAKKIVGQVNVSGNDTPITSFKLSGAGSDKFTIDGNGTLYAKADAGFDYERESSYVIYIVATTDAGSSEPLKVTIPIGDVEESPRISYFSTNVDENATAGTVVGKVNILGHGDSPIVSMALSGDGSENFTIDTKGTVRVSSTAKLDYETKNYYYIKAVATNRNGHSSNNLYGEFIEIYLNNVPDEPIIELNDTYSVDENATEGTVIGKIHIVRNGDSPIDHFEVRNSYYESDHGIQIDSNGTMRTGKNTALDYETAPSIYIYIRAVNKNGNMSTYQRADIVVNNIPDEPILKKNQQFNVDENARNGTKVGSIVVTDEGDSPVVSYETNDYYQTFTVDGNGTIIIKDNSMIDYEQNHQIGFSVRAKNKSGKYSQWAYIQININNITDEPIVENGQHFKIEENATVGTVVGELNITSSGDSPIDTITIYSDDEMFSIDTDGIIYVAKKLDYEYKHKYREYVKITNKNGNPVYATITIDLINIPDDPVLDRYTNCRIRENAPVGTKICQIGIIEEGDSPIVSIDFVDNEGKKLNTPFAIDTNGTITVANSDNLDYETKNNYYLRAVATNKNGLKSRLYDYDYYDDYEERGGVYITLINDPDDAPVLQRKVIYIDENISVGEKIGNILKNKGKADIIEAEIYSTTYYAYGNPPSGEPSKLFDVDLNGSISVKASLDYDKSFKPCQNNVGSQRYCEYVNIVMTNRYGSTTLYQQEIEIGNVPDAPPVLGGATFSIMENTAVGTIVGSVEVEKEGEGSITGFSILNSEDFDIDENGTIRVAGSLDFEAQNIYDLNITASNQYSTSDIVSVKINIVDVADVVPILKSFSGKIDENISYGAMVGEIGVLYAGDSPIESITLLGDGSDEFVVDDDGVIRISQKADIDYERKNLYTLKAVAKNMAGYSLPTDVNISINDIRKIVLFDYTGSIKENSPAGTKVGAIAMDRSEGSPAKITLTGIGHEHFSVDSNGIIRVSNGAKIDYEKQAKYLLHAEAENSFVHSNIIDVNISVENMPETPPKISYFYKGVYENSSGGTVVGTVDIESETAIQNIVLRGSGSEKFIIDLNGTVRVAEGADLDYEQQNYYYLTIEARNSYAVSSRNITIYLKNVPDTPPSIYAWGYLVVEDGQDGSVEVGGGRVWVESDSNVSYVRLEGEGADDFAVNIDGSIKIAGGVVIDKNTISAYHLKLVAGNDFGETTKDIAIKVHDSDHEIPDTGDLQLSLITDLQKDDDGNFYVVGTKWKYDGYYRNISVVAKYDQDKTLLWTCELDVEDGLNSWGERVDPKRILLKEGRLYLVGSVFGKLKDADYLYDDEGVMKSKLFVTAIGLDGIPLWKKQFGSSENDMIVNALYQNEKVYVASNMDRAANVDDNESSSSRAVVYVLDENGTIKEKRQFDALDEFDKVISFKANYNGIGFYFHALIDNEVYYVNYDENLSMHDRLQLSEILEETEYQDACQDSMRNIYMIDLIKSREARLPKPYIKKYSSDGTLLWQRNYDITMWLKDIYCDEQGFVLNGQNADGYGYVLEFDGDGNLINIGEYGLNRGWIYFIDKEKFFISDPAASEGAF